MNQKDLEALQLLYAVGHDKITDPARLEDVQKAINKVKVIAEGYKPATELVQRRPHEDCPELSENEIIKEAARIRHAYEAALSQLVRNFQFSEATNLWRLCDLAKGNNCAAHIYNVIDDLRASLRDLIQYHRFNHSVHRIDLR